MKKLLLVLGIATGGALLGLLGFLVGSGWNRQGSEPNTAKAEVVKNPGDAGTNRRDLSNPPPPPPPVLNEVRVRENLKPGSTYLVKTRLAFSMRGTDHDWWVANSVVRINYMADAVVERKIEANDGKTIEELRTFKRVFSGKIDTELERFSIDLGPTGDFLIGGAALLQPEALPVVAGAVKFIDGLNLSAALKATGLAQSFVDDAVQNDPRIKAATSMGTLEGKTVKLIYQNDREGDIQVIPVQGALSGDEQRFLASSVLLADSLIFPDVEVQKGDTWEADSMYFIGLIDPSLLARPEGKVKLRRGSDIALPATSGQKQKCVQVDVIGGELNFHESSSKADQVGYFKPQEGKLLFSPQDRIFLQADLSGRGKLTITQKDHVICQARSDREAELKIHYECRVLGSSEK